MSAPCSRCDCLGFKGDPGSDFCMACWHSRSAHHLIVCPNCGARIEPVRIPLEAASWGEGWAALTPGPAVPGQQVLWESGAWVVAAAAADPDEDTAETPAPEVAAAHGDASEEGPVQPGEQADPEEAGEPPASGQAPGQVRLGARLRARLRREDGG
ncbi:MAG: hypothetical protein ACXVZP_04665 [Gaiellaceae bacterium]